MLHKDKLIVFRKIVRILSVFVVKRRAVVFGKTRKSVFQGFLTRAKNTKIWQSSTVLLTSDGRRFE